MTGQYTYLVLGAGRQGRAAAYDLACRGEASQVLLADADEITARESSEQVNARLGKPIVHSLRADARDTASIKAAMAGMDACLSAVPYYFNLELTRCAVDMGVSLCDLGGNLDIAREQHRFDSEARNAGISIIPNCGQVPGLGTSLIVYAMQLLDECSDIYMWDGGIPQTPKLPFQYLLTFNVAGLTNEYAEPGMFLRDGKITQVEPMTELETIDFPEPIGRLEAFVTGGGTDTMPWTFAGKLRTLQNLTLRYPGHFAQLRAYYDLGLWSLDPVQIGAQEIIPREVFHTLFTPKVTDPTAKDIVIVRVIAEGKKAQQAARALVEVIDYYDDLTGFTAMERTTGWSAAIVAAMMAHGQTPRGAGGVESMVPAGLFVDELIRRGINVKQEVTER